MEINELINKIIENQKDNTTKEIEFLCGECNFDKPVNVIETDKIKIIFKDNKCEIRRKKNNNPVIFRDKIGKIFRQHGEWVYLKPEMLNLAGMNTEANNQITLNQDFVYD